MVKDAGSPVPLPPRGTAPAVHPSPVPTNNHKAREHGSPKPAQASPVAVPGNRRKAPMPAAQRESPPGHAASTAAATAAIPGHAVLPRGSVAPFSLRGLITARRFTRNLKAKTAQRIAERKQMEGRAGTGDHGAEGGSAGAGHESFPVERLERLLEETLTRHLGGGEALDAAACARLAPLLSEEIKARAKEQTPTRYKLIVSVTLGSWEREQVVVASRCLWDPAADAFASHHYRRGARFCVATIFGVYYE
ncbi:dynein light chain Tctex-type 4-like [Lethenteron reissneri]|uniref:dynein light chain Tctex-type 4-like n=1 Tax=Lethenteron reissneri TaxID=7753 RepID=UPI002AB7247D|nr:dynein light chain Tctex-type 4-like [Lethenteron reissneri]